jgi:hypothetical protein
VSLAGLTFSNVTEPISLMGWVAGILAVAGGEARRGLFGRRASEASGLG